MKAMTIKQVVVRITVIISVAELLIMVALGHIPFHAGLYYEAVIDVTALIVLSTPPIYIWVITPFVTARDEALAQLTHLAHFDPLTQLANRRLFSMHLEKALAGNVRHKDYGAVLLIDLDGFKQINDAHCHEAGDAVLIEIAERLRANARSADIVARLGGDEFAVLINRLGADSRVAREKALRVGEKLISSLGTPLDFKGTKLNFGASIGINLLDFEHPDIDTALRRADIAMYRAKQAGKRRAVIFDNTLHAES